MLQSTQITQQWCVTVELDRKGLKTLCSALLILPHNEELSLHRIFLSSLLENPEAKPLSQIYIRQVQIYHPNNHFNPIIYLTLPVYSPVSVLTPADLDFSSRNH